MVGSSPCIVSMIDEPISSRNAAPLAVRSRVANAMPGAAAAGVSVGFVTGHLWQARQTFDVPVEIINI